MRALVIFIQLAVCHFIWGQSISNHSFESINEDPNQIAGWTKSTSEATTIRIDTINYVDGVKSVKISGKDVGWIRQSIAFKIHGKPVRIRFKANVKTSLIAGYAKLVGRVVDNRGIAKYEAMRTRMITGRTAWTEYSLDMIVDSLTTEIRIAGYFDGTGEAYFDNFRFTPINEPEPYSTSQDVLAYTQKYLQIIKDNALYKDSIDFNSLEKTILKLSKSVSSIRDCLPILTYTLHSLNDGHSFLMPAEQVENWSSDNNLSVTLPTAKIIGQVGYIAIPQFNSNSDKITQYFADSLQSAIKWLDKAGVTGWIVDVRNNGGGNCWPMITGIGPLIGDGIYGYVISRNGDKKPWSYYKGASKEGDSNMTKVLNPYSLTNINRPIAVLINNGTASSAEMLAISFMGIPDVKLFGSASYGATTENNEFQLDDGSLIFLCTGIYVTRDLKKFGSKIQPDKYVSENPNSKSDKVLREALKWIKTRK